MVKVFCYRREKGPGAWFNIKMFSYQYRKSHCGVKTIENSPSGGVLISNNFCSSAVFFVIESSRTVNSNANRRHLDNYFCPAMMLVRVGSSYIRQPVRALHDRVYQSATYLMEMVLLAIVVVFTEHVLKIWFITAAYSYHTKQRDCIWSYTRIVSYDFSRHIFHLFCRSNRIFQNT